MLVLFCDLAPEICRNRLVAEAWMVPSLFEGTNDARIIDEWTMGLYLGRTAATARMTEHWATWITEGEAYYEVRHRVLACSRGTLAR